MPIRTICGSAPGMLVANENPWWSLRQCTSSLIFQDYHKFHNEALERFWLELHGTISNSPLHIEHVNALSQQITNSLTSFHFLGEDELSAVMHHFLGDLYVNFKQYDKAVVLLKKSFDIYTNLYGSHYVKSILISSEHYHPMLSKSWYHGITNFLIPPQSTFFLKQQKHLHFYNDHRNIKRVALELTEQALLNNSKALSTLKKSLEVSHSSWYYLFNQTTSERGFAFSNFEASTAEILKNYTVAVCDCVFHLYDFFLLLLLSSSVNTSLTYISDIT